MRLWSLHPRYLDRPGLTAAWREALLAQAVIDAPGRGYGRHPQLQRFRAASEPGAAIGAFLGAIADEADSRCYRFDRSRIVVAATTATVPSLTVTTGQLAYEWGHLTEKLRTRSPADAERWTAVLQPEAHPLFVVVPGPIADWERPLAPAARD